MRLWRALNMESQCSRKRTVLGMNRRNKRGSAHHSFKPMEIRFWAKVNKGTLTGCWEWIGSTNYEYGQLWLNGKVVLAHIISYEMHRGAIPKGQVVMHSCDNPLCVRPEHLSLGTPKDNVIDALTKGRYLGRETRKLSKEVRQRLKERIRAGEKHKILAAEFGLAMRTVQRWASEINKSDVGLY